MSHYNYCAHFCLFSISFPTAVPQNYNKNYRHSLASSEKVGVSIGGVEESGIYFVFRKASAQLFKGFRISMIQSSLVEHPVLITYRMRERQREINPLM